MHTANAFPYPFTTDLGNGVQAFREVGHCFREDNHEAIWDAFLPHAHTVVTAKSEPGRERADVALSAVDGVPETRDTVGLGFEEQAVATTFVIDDGDEQHMSVTVGERREGAVCVQVHAASAAWRAVA